MPQWSPVTRTGKTSALEHVAVRADEAAMEPGHEDRENIGRSARTVQRLIAAMEPGHEDRENQL